MFRTIEGFLSKDVWKQELVFVFGKCEADNAIPSEYVYKIPNSRFVKAEKLCSGIDAKMFEHGLTFVADEAVGKKDGSALQQLQMHLIAEYYKKHFFNTFTPFTPSPSIQDLLGKLKDPSRSISQLCNMPWLLRFPLADKLRDQKIGLPILILMAGPSLHAIKKHLKNLAQRYLVVCIARSLQPCLDSGVEPDFVVQYDTNLEQKLFYNTITRLNKTVLISLSSASISDYAWKFRGIFFRASFKMMLLPNPYVLRDSTESSLLACMGLAEALGAPEALIAGADFSWLIEEGRYCSEASPENLESLKTDDYQIIRDSVGLRILGRDGRKMVSDLGYVAAAGRDSEFAREIQSSVGTRFFLTSNTGIMSPTEFPTASLDKMFDTPLIDRDSYLKMIDGAINTKEIIDLKTAVQYFSSLANFLSVQELNFRIRKHNPDFQFKLYDEFVLLMSNIRSLILPPLEAATCVHNIVEHWSHAYKYAKKIALAYLLAQTESLPVLCIDSEYDRIHECIDGFFPIENLDMIVLTCFAVQEKSQRKTIEDTSIGKWLRDQQLVFVSPAVLNRYNFLFGTLEDDNVIPLPQL